MTFGEKVRILRKRASMGQGELAEQIGVTRRALVYYENNERYPREQAVIDRLADTFAVTPDFLTNDREYILQTKEEFFLAEAAKEDARRGGTEAKHFLEQTHSLFAGGELSDDDKDALFEVLTEIYFDSKKKAKKYSSKTPRA